MFDVYKNENEEFISKIYVPECQEIAEYLKGIFNNTFINSETKI